MKGNWRNISSTADIENELNRIRVLSRIAFKANDIRAYTITLNPDSADLSDTIVSLYTWNTEGNSELQIAWNEFISRVNANDLEMLTKDFQQLTDGIINELKLELRVVDSDGSNNYRWREITASLYERDEKNRPLVFLISSTDIHDRKSQELNLEEAIFKAEKADKMKSKYLADMSHEIRTPLNAITGFAELMAFTESSEERMSYYDVIRTNNQMLMQLINDILDLSKIEADVVQINYEPVDVDDLLDSAFASTRLRMPPRVKLQMEKGNIQHTFGTDPIRLLQLITNLANNAIKHTREGSITIGYKCLPDNQLHFFVRDTGLGIPEEKQKQLFGRFAKVNDYAEGIGLGLAICQGLVTKMGGSLHVESKPGVGSEFSFILPSHKTTI